MQELKDLAKQCDIDEAVEFTGKESDIKDVMSKAAGFLMCTKFEGLGRVTVEAMFYGCPVLARNNSGGTMEIVKNNETGLIFDDAADLSDKMQIVASGDMLPIIHNAQQYAVGHFCEESFGEQMLKLYKNVLNQ
jgi:glycosyltransferase involved in cell wall biosynthesis